MGHIEILKAWVDKNDIYPFYMFTSRLPEYDIWSAEFSIEEGDSDLVYVERRQKDEYFSRIPITFFADILGMDL